MSRIAIDARAIDVTTKTGIGIYAAGVISSLYKYRNNNEYYMLYSSIKRDADQMPGPSEDRFSKVKIAFPNRRGEIFRRAWPYVLGMNLRRLKADIYHSLFDCNMPPKSNKTRQVLTVHDLHKLKLNDTFPQSKYAQVHSEMRNAISNADIIVAVSEATKKDIIDCFGISEKKIKVIHPSIDPAYRKIDDSQAMQSFREKYGLPDKYILTIGDVPRKNPLKTIEAFKYLKERYSIPHKLVFAGIAGHWSRQNKDYAKKLGIADDIIWMGYIADAEMPFLYNCADVFIFPSLYEGFGLPVLEAMACGLPVVTSNLTSLPEIGGEAAIYVNPHDAGDIGEKLYQTITDLRLRHDLLTKGFKRVKLFSWKKHARELEAVYSSLA